MSEDELWNVLQTLDATVNCMALDQDTSDLVMRMQEEALQLVLDLLDAPTGATS